MPSATESTPAGIRRDVSLSEKTYYHIGGRADYLAEPGTLEDLAEALRFARARSLPIAVLGAGTNTLFSDEKFPGLVISCSRLASWHWETDDTLYAEAGVACTELAAACHAASRSGAAWMFRLPGLLGAAIRMNARCFGGEVSQICVEVLSLDAEGCLHLRKGKEVFLGYKDTFYIRSPEVVVAARLHFPVTAPREEILAEMHRHEGDRLQKHHFDFPSCGSTFKNNYALGVPSGRIFDELGLRGTRVGGALVSPHHANFIYNTGNASAHDVLTLAARMRQMAHEAGRGPLDLEVEAIGTFPAPLLKACGLAHEGHGETHWAGLFRHPEERQDAPRWPRRVFSSFFLEYWRTPKRGVPPVWTELLQHLSLTEARKNPDLPFLTWTTRTPLPAETHFGIKPAEAPGSFVPELWHASVSEIFLARPDAAEYDEYELTPDLHWLAIALCGPRVRKPGHEAPGPRYWDGLERFREEREGVLEFGMHFPYKRLSHLLDFQDGKSAALRIQCCLSLGNAHYLLAPHWKNASLEPTWDEGRTAESKPDFHQPKRFWLVPLG